MFEDALRYPYSDGEGVKTLLVGTLLSLLGVLLLPAVFVAGYTVRVLRAVAADEETLPDWDDWADLFVDGLRAIAVGVAYLLVPLLLVVGAALAFFVPITGEPTRLVTLLAWAVALLSLPSLFAATYALPAALVNVAVTRRVGAGFAFRRLWPVLTDGNYATAWLLALLVSLLSGVIVGLVVLVPLAGFVVAVAVGFYATLTTAYLYGRGVARSRPVDQSTPESSVSA
jgi:hypothetical protein